MTTQLPRHALIDPGRDWEARKSREAIPFDVLIIAQDAIWSENELLIDMGAELAAVIQENRRIYRLRDGRFATLVNRSAMRGSPRHLEVWNWWLKTGAPGIRDFAEASEIDVEIKERSRQNSIQ